MEPLDDLHTLKLIAMSPTLPYLYTFRIGDTPKKK